MINELVNELESKINLMKGESEAFKAKVRELLSVKRSSAKRLLPFFSYSIILDNNANGKHTIYGNFNIINHSPSPLYNPKFVLKIKSDHAFDFSGKYIMPTQHIKIENLQWKLVENKNENEAMEYWFTPTGAEQIDPDQTLSFSNFQIRFQNEASGYINVEGHVYVRDINEGMPSLNSINISF
ncbi:hypothetical protein CVD25_08405 [Bacillus canaveralius]|uniref:Uncharacterized protein n=1 Tax=Bacillus canaveralius TaxID=1403243 RepID=A0A2N5GIE2_9BACI|nr:hypothetical protein [Bacillus canaveralius]PLR80743.1 hypothetical protein CU635_16965 [Bacillus canaveralius]PLR98379.1 hypothetical protein CVD25_08405 [Bacillus canaveralius]